MRILVVDDDPLMLQALSDGIPAHWQDCAIIQASDGGAALAEFIAQDPDLVVLDLGLPGRDGIEVLREIRRSSDTPVIILTGREGELEEVRGLETGADDFMMKPLSLPMLVARARAVLRRRSLPTPVRAIPAVQGGDIGIYFDERQVMRGDDPVKLTPFEFEVLAELAHHPGRLIHYEALLNRVWGATGRARTEHLKVFISRLRAKLEPDPSHPSYIVTERGVGYRLVGGAAARPESSTAAS
jgi:two-component system KDP operon response regulator KdpE